MPTSRWGLGLAVLNGKIYAIGGESFCNPNISTVETTVVEIYDPASDAWSPGPPLVGGSLNTCTNPYTTGMAGIATFVLNGKIYAVGGTGLPAAGTVEVFDPVSGTWSSSAVPARPTAAVLAGTYVSGALLNGKFYTVDSNGATEIYDTVSNNWTQGATLSQADSGSITPNAGSFTANGAFYAVGAVGGVGFTSVYSPGITMYTFTKN